MRRIPGRIPLLLGVMAVVCSACGKDDRPPVAPVQGRVLYRGKPVAGATVTFVHQGAPRHSYGTTDEQGQFTLTTFEPEDGAIVGVNRVTVVKSAMPGAELGGDIPDPEAYSRAMEKADQSLEPTSELPSRYADAGTSGLEVTVEAGENRPVLELVD